MVRLKPCQPHLLRCPCHPAASVRTESGQQSDGRYFSRIQVQQAKLWAKKHASGDMGEGVRGVTVEGEGVRGAEGESVGSECQSRGRSPAVAGSEGEKDKEE